VACDVPGHKRKEGREIFRGISHRACRFSIIGSCMEPAVGTRPARAESADKLETETPAAIRGFIFCALWFCFGGTGVLHTITWGGTSDSDKIPTETYHGLTPPHGPEGRNTVLVSHKYRN